MGLWGRGRGVQALPTQLGAQRGMSVLMEVLKG